MIGGAVVGGNSLFDAIELRHDRALGNPLFIDFDCVGASKIAPPWAMTAGRAIFAYAATAVGPEIER